MKVYKFAVAVFLAIIFFLLFVRERQNSFALEYKIMKLNSTININKIKCETEKDIINIKCNNEKELKNIDLTSCKRELKYNNDKCTLVCDS